MPIEHQPARAGRRWDAFISYAQVPDLPVAQALRDGIQSFGKSAFALRRARVFLDDSALSPSADLPRSLQDALATSRKLILLCCPEAAQSRWVKKEVRFWLDTRHATDIILVRTGGLLGWVDGQVVPPSDALPDVLHGAFEAEPLWLDLGWARGHQDLRRAPALRTALARLASAVLDLPLDEIEGDDVRSQRLLRRLRAAAVAGLTLLTAASAGLAVWAEINRRTAIRQGRIALERSLALSARSASAGTPSLVNGQRAGAYALSVTPAARGAETWEAASSALGTLPRALIQRETGVTAGAFEPGGSGFAIAAGRQVSAHEGSGSQRWCVMLEKSVAALAWQPTTKKIAVLDVEGDVTVLSDGGQALSRLTGVGSRRHADGQAPTIRNASESLMVAVTPAGLTLFDLTSDRRRSVPAAIDRAIPCGDTEVWAQPDGTVMALRLTAGVTPRIVHRHSERVTFLACAAQGESIASASERDDVLWTRAGVTSRQPLHGVAAIALAPSGDRLAVRLSAVEQKGRLDVRQGISETLLFADSLMPKAFWRTSLSSPWGVLAFHGDHLLIADDRTALLRLDARGLTRLDRLPATDQVDHMIGSSTPDDVIVVTKDGRIQAVDFRAASRRSLGPTTGWATSAMVNDDRTGILLYSMFDGADVQDQRRSATLITPGLAAPVSFDPVVRDVALVESLGVLSLRALADGRTALTLTRAEPYGGRSLFDAGGQYESVAVSEDGSRIVLWGQHGALLADPNGHVVWRDPDWSTPPEFVGRGKGVLLRQEAPLLISAIDGLRVQLPFETAAPGTVKVDPSMRFAAAVTNDRHELWDIHTQRLVYQVAANSSWSSAFTPDGEAFVAVTAHGVIDVVALQGPRSIRHVPTSLTIDGDLALDESGRAAFVSAREGVGRLELVSGAFALLDVPGGAHRVVVAPKERGIIVGYPDDNVFVVDTTGKVAGQVRLSGALSEAVFAEDGSVAAIGSLDGGVRVVDMASGRLLADIRAGGGAVTDLAISTDGSWLLVEGLTRTHLVPLDPYSRLCRLAVRSLSAQEWREAGGTGPVPKVCQMSIERQTDASLGGKEPRPVR